MEIIFMAKGIEPLPMENMREALEYQEYYESMGHKNSFVYMRVNHLQVQALMKEFPLETETFVIGIRMEPVIAPKVGGVK